MYIRRHIMSTVLCFIMYPRVHDSCNRDLIRFDLLKNLLINCFLFQFRDCSIYVLLNVYCTNFLT